jgi:hypothetical protein
LSDFKWGEGPVRKGPAWSLPPVARPPLNASKGLPAQAAAAKTPWRRNIRLEKAKLHLHSLKERRKIKTYLFPILGKLFWGKQTATYLNHGVYNKGN